MDFETILLKKEQGIATITLNRPGRLNAVNAQMAEELPIALNEVTNDPEVKVLVLTGAGRAFCSGLDLADRARSTGAPPGVDERREALRHGLERMPLVLHSLEIPTIAMVNGAAVGLGFDLTLTCDMRVGSENARFMVAFTRVGLCPGTGGAWLMARHMGVGKACELLFTGDFLEAREAEKIGVLNKLVPADELEKVTMELAAKIAKGPPIAIKLDKLLVRKALEIDNFATAMELSAFAATMTNTSEDYKEGVKAFLEKRTPKFKGK